MPPEFVTAQLEAVFDDIGVDSAKTGMLFSRPIIEVVAAYLSEHPVPLVVGPGDGCEPGAKLLQDDAVGALVSSLFPLATVVTPNLPEAESLAGSRRSGESWLSGSMRSRFCRSSRWSRRRGRRPPL